MKKRLVMALFGLVVALTIGVVSCSISEKADAEIKTEATAEKETKKKDTKEEKVSEDKKEEDEKEKEDEKKKEDSKDTSKSNSSNDKKSDSSDDKKKTESSDSKKDDSSKKEETKEDTKKDEHTHNWTPVYKEVDNGHYEKQLVKEAWVEEKVITKKVGCEICKGCGHVMFTMDDIKSHQKTAVANGNYGCGSYYSGYTEVEEVVEIPHDAVYDNVWVPKIEKVLDYYKCDCGAMK